MAKKPTYEELEQRVKELEEKVLEQGWAQGASEDSEKRFGTLFKLSPDGILIAELTTSRFTYANPAMCKMLGYSKCSPRIANLSRPITY